MKAAVVALALVVAACAGEDERATAPRELVGCDDLRAREREIIAAANEGLAAIAATDDDRARYRALVDAHESVLTVIDRHVAVGVDADTPRLEAELAAGIRAARVELAGAREALVGLGGAVAASDERGRVGELQTAIEKAFSLMEPPRSSWVAAGLAEATDADPDCRFVTQRGDPAA